MSIEQVLSGAPENTERPDLPEETPAAETPEQPQEKVEQPAEPTPAPTGQTVPLQALQDERRKRQELEQKLAQQQQPEKPGFWEKPEEYLETVRNEARLEGIRSKLDITEDFARSKYKDYDEQLVVFQGLVQQNPNLFHQMLQARNPAEFAYSVAKNHATVQQAGSLEEMRTKMEAEIRAKVEAEYKAKADAEVRKRDAIPETLTDVQSGSVREAAFAGPKPLNEILK